MYTVLYSFKIKSGKNESFVELWNELTDLIYQFENSLGSRLHQSTNNEYIAYAQWPSKTVFDLAGNNLPDSANQVKIKMKACCENIEIINGLNIVSDKLASQSFNAKNNEPRVTGLGGVFLKAENPKALKKWYTDHLGLVTDDYGSTFEFRDTNSPKTINYLQWSLFKNDTDYFTPSTKAFMLNYRVHKLESLVEALKEKGVDFCDDIEAFDYGKFVHIMDIEGNKIELWEPIDKVFTDSLKGNTTK